jgi:ketosteroid isomerase-like protein
MHPNSSVIGRLFEALKAGDYRGAAECYAMDARFRDIAFDLEGRSEIAAMWHLVCSRGVEITYRFVRADEATGSASWEAHYTFSKTGRPVHNMIQSEFTFRDGAILRHFDRADRWRWAWQAQGFPLAIVIGLLPSVLRKKAALELAHFKAAHPERGT